MKKYPFPILIVSILLMIAGIVGFVYHFQDFFDLNQKIYITLLVELLRIVAIVAGVLLLRANNIGRWLAIGWVLLHVIISTFNSVEQTIMHTAVLVVFCTLLFLPVSSNFFRSKPSRPDRNSV